MKTIPVKEIKLNRLDGTREERREAIITKTDVASVYEVASSFLRLAATTAPVDSDHEFAFDVVFEDGEVYSGTVHLRYENSKTGYDIAVHIRNFAETYTGKKRPSHLSQEQYEAGIKKVPADQRKQYERLLTKGYDLTPTPKIEDDAPAHKSLSYTRDWRFNNIAVRPEAERVPVADPNDHSCLNDGFFPPPPPEPEPMEPVKVGSKTVLGNHPLFMKPARA